MSYEGVQIEAEMRCDCGKNPHEKSCAYYFNKEECCAEGMVEI